MTARPLFIRPSTDHDLPAIHAIYGEAVRHRTGTFETEAPDLMQMAGSRGDVLARGQPWRVAVAEGQTGAAVLGYACASLFRPRQAYRYSLEDSIYLHPEARGRGIGRLLLAKLLVRCEVWGAGAETPPPAPWATRA